MTKEERAKDYTEHNIGKYTNDYANIYNAYLKGAEEETKELEKENAELKTKLLQEREIYWCKGFDSSKDKLTKAKEIIDKLLKSLFLAKGIIRDLIDDTVDFDE